MIENRMESLEEHIIRMESVENMESPVSLKDVCCRTEQIAPIMENSLFKRSRSDIYESGFDKEHPFPTYEELRNAGFSEHIAREIVFDRYNAPYSQRQLYIVLYESDDPVAAYNEMMEGYVKIWEQEMNDWLKEAAEILSW